PTIRVFSRPDGLTIDIKAHDRIGLLHDLAAVLARLNLDVELAKVDTRGSEAVDVFEVRDRSGIPTEEIRAALVTAAS
ncbi:MAG: ACT domain-containing protein, partial [Acidimicrobiia bacterium]